MCQLHVYLLPYAGQPTFRVGFRILHDFLSVKYGFRHGKLLSMWTYLETRTASLPSDVGFSLRRAGACVRARTLLCLRVFLRTSVQATWRWRERRIDEHWATCEGYHLGKTDGRDVMHSNEVNELVVWWDTQKGRQADSQADSQAHRYKIVDTLLAKCYIFLGWV